jgi:hypothetical protein
MRGLQIDNQLESQWRLYREVIWRRALQDFIRISGGLSKNDHGVDPIR